MAYIIPIRAKSGSGRGPTILVVILDRDNLDRMREGDPFDLRTIAYGDHLPLDRPIRDLDIVIAYEEDVEPLLKFKETGDLAGLWRHLERGRRHRTGDVQPPTPLRRS